MILHPDSIEQLQEQISKATAVDGLDLSAIDQLIEHVPEDMTATVQAGMSLEQFQAKLAEQNQWLPIDPPHPAELSIGELLASNASGPQRFGCGTIRDWLIGIAVVLPDGRLIRNGGKVVKNVAGFDLCKLFVGSRGELGVIVEATFKLLPQPEAEIILQCPRDSLASVGDLLERVWDSDLQPCVLDLHGPPLVMVLGLAGPRADVEAQVAMAREMGFKENATLDYDGEFPKGCNEFTSVAPANLILALEKLGGEPFVARAGNGVIYHRGAKAVEVPAVELQRRVKEAFDPKGILAR